LKFFDYVSVRIKFVCINNWMSVRSVSMSVFGPEANIFTLDKTAAPVRDTHLCAQFHNTASRERSNFATTGMTLENLNGNLTSFIPGIPA
jgi:hypothetical protein